MTLSIRPARSGEAGLVLQFVRELAAYEKLTHEVAATEVMIDAALFGPNPRVFCDIAEWAGEPVGNALWFLNFSTFSGRSGLYLEDLFVHLARRCVAAGWARFEWSVLDWNAPSIAFYQSIGAQLKDEWTICRVSGEALAQLAQKDV
jgi:hypothetical protein